MITIEVISQLVSVLFVALIGYAAWRKRERALFAVPALLYMAHVIFFYSVLLLNLDLKIGIDVTAQWFNIWSASIRLQGTISFGLTALALVWGTDKYGHR